MKQCFLKMKFILSSRKKINLKNYILPKLDLADPNELFESVRRSLALESKGSVSGSFRLSYNFGNKKYLYLLKRFRFHEKKDY